MKKIVKLISLIIFILGILTFSSCGNDKVSKSEGIAPTYLGVRIEKITSTARLKSFKSSNPNKGNDNTEGNNGWHGKKDDKSDDEYIPEDNNEEVLNKDIEDILDINVITDDSVKYFVNPEEVFILVVELNNPSNFEIQSFTLNGKKYANYMFEENSDMENLYLKVSAPSTSGYVDYTVDAIKYIDGTKIKDVDLSSGNQTIKAGVKYIDNVTSSVENIKVTPTSISCNVTINDENSIANEAIMMYLSDGNKVVDSKKLYKGINSVTFDDLMIDKKYQYIITGIYDLCDGNYNSEHILSKDVVSTTEAYNISNVSSTETKIDFLVNCLDNDATISKLDLYIMHNGELTLAESNKTNDFTFDNLKSNRKYVIYLEYNYTHSDENLTMYYAYEINTLAKEAPKLEFEDIDYTLDSISFDYKLTDKDNICVVEQYELYLEEELKQTITDLIDKTFEGLLSNNEYTVKIKYSYDLNDGEGVHNEVSAKVGSTLAKEEPKLEFEEIDYTLDSISFDYKLTDKDNICVVEQYELYLGEELKQTITDLTDKTFEGLLSNNEYTVKIKYSYDLNDGEGVHNEVSAKVGSTLAKEAPKLEFEEIDYTLDSISFDYKLTDKNNICVVEQYELYLEEELKQTITDLTDKTFEGLLSNNEYIVKVKYSYDLNDGEGAHIEKISQFVDIYQFTFSGSIVTGLNPKFETTNLIISEKAYIDGVEYVMKTIASQAFMDNVDLVSVTIPLTITLIDVGAFRDCNYLQNITFTENSLLEEIRSAAFLNCPLNDDLVLPASLKTMGNEAFRNISSRTLSFEENSKLETIMGYAFYVCENLEKVILPSGLKMIGEYGFARCNLKEIIIPESTTKIGKNAFELQSINIYLNVNVESQYWANNWNSGNKYYFASEWHLDENGDIQLHETI